MESAAVLRSFQYSICTSSDVKSVLRKPGMATTNNAALFGGKAFSSSNRGALYLSCAKKSETTVAAKTNSESNGAVLSDSKSGKKLPFTGTFPTGFEDMLSEVCDETQIAELRVKYGSFEINMKRKIDSPAISAPIVAQAAAAPAPSKPATPATPTEAPKSSTEKVSPFTNISVEKAAKLDALKASGSSSYVIVSSPTVGSFRRARTFKGKKQQPACKEGDVIKEGQVIGYVDQFGTELPVNSDVEGEVLKILFSDGEPVGYGDPLMAVLPSFHGIR